MRNFLNQ
jgi:5'-3' exonuclease